MVCVGGRRSPPKHSRDAKSKQILSFKGVPCDYQVCCVSLVLDAVANRTPSTTAVETVKSKTGKHTSSTIKMNLETKKLLLNDFPFAKALKSVDPLPKL